MKNTLKKIWNVIKTIVVAVLVLITISLFITKLAGDTPNFMGYNFYYIVSESMEPDLEVGDVIISKKVNDIEKLEIGDVITYKGEVGSFANKLITHQIIDIKEENGEIIFITKGTNPSCVVDPDVSEDQVISKMLFKIPLLGKLMKVVNHPTGFILLIGLPLGICLLSEIINFIKVCKSKDDEDEEDEQENKETKC